MPEAERITVTKPLSHMSTKNTIIGVNDNLYTATGLGTDIFVFTGQTITEASERMIITC